MSIFPPKPCLFLWPKCMVNFAPGCIAFCKHRDINLILHHKLMECCQFYQTLVVSIDATNILQKDLNGITWFVGELMTPHLPCSLSEGTRVPFIVCTSEVILACLPLEAPLVILGLCCCSQLLCLSGSSIFLVFVWFCCVHNSLCRHVVYFYIFVVRCYVVAWHM